MGQEPSEVPWRRNLVAVAGVFLTVTASLLMSQLDSLRTRIVPKTERVVVTQVAELVFTSTPLPAISLPTATPTLSIPTPTKSIPTPIPTKNSPTASVTPINTETPSPSPTLQPTETPSETAVANTTESQCVISPPNSWVNYQVKSGDTLYALSLKSGANINQVRQVNCLETDDLVSGTFIFLPVALPTPVNCDPSPPPSWESYIVVRGDTTFKLARSRGLSLTEVQEVNCLFGDRLPAGSQIFLPPSLNSDTTPPSTTVPGEPTATATTVVSVWNITSPSNGATVTGIQPILGTANFDPNKVIFYKIELAPTDGSSDWITLGVTHSTPVINGQLEILNAAGLQSGEYFLRLVLIENSNYVGEPFTIQFTIE